ncbi:MAG: Rrf2 family transcriptional regulator [Bacteroidetes bacterium RBG_19FT_COMBO_42_7]|nr:MAG: Rrf2 family transcriptional regulator [Bacteroidetes bacterium RBG_13_42_15]OFY76236.1 MAG: Rrf2 family transcriptional regulator [Bacteroidetes bacterium RBG_19FT_COMBO_42_7]
MLSKKTRYAMVALAKLARDYGKGPIQIREISEKENIPRSFLENILLELRKMGILGSQLGKSGGYYLLRKPNEVHLAEIIDHFEGTLSLLYCVSEKAYRPCEFCKDEATCQIRRVFKEILANTNSILQKATLETLTKR